MIRCVENDADIVNPSQVATVHIMITETSATHLEIAKQLCPMDDCIFVVLHCRCQSWAFVQFHCPFVYATKLEIKAAGCAGEQVAS